MFPASVLFPNLYRIAVAFILVAITTTTVSLAIAQQKAVMPKPTSVASTPAATATKMGAAEKITSVEGITEYRLPNGMKVLLYPDQSKPTAVVNVTYLVGTRHENYGETGMAHLLEHLLFKGTLKNPDIAQQHNQRGMSWNASTSRDRTNFYQTFQASDENLEWALQMEADRMVNSFIAKKDLDSEMTVVRNEFELRESQPFFVMIKRMQSIAYDWHNYGNTTLGNRSDIENVKIENLQAFYHTYYRPDNAVLMVAGKFDEAKVIAWVSKYFSALKNPKLALPSLWTIEPTQDGERTFAIRRKGDVQIVALGYKIPSTLYDDADAIQMANFILSDSPTGRLHKAFIETGKATEVFGLPLTGIDGGLHMMGVVVKKGEAIEPVQAELIRIVENFYNNPPTKEELERAQRAAANAAEVAMNNHETIGLQMSELIALGDWRLFFHSRDRTQKVTIDEVKTAAGAYYKRDNRVTGVYMSADNLQRAEIPVAPTAAVVLKDFKASATVSQTEAFDASNTNIDKRTKRIEIDGISVALLAKKNRGETVYAAIRFRSGDEKTLFGKTMIGSFADQMLSRGTTKLSRAQLADELEKLKVTGDVSGLSANIQTTRSNLVAAIKLAAHMMREPSFPEAEFEQLKKQMLAGLEIQKNNPQALASITLNNHFNIFPRGDARYSRNLIEAEADVKAVTLQQVRDYHQQFYASNKGEIAIVGDFDEVTTTAAIREAFGDWKGGVAYVRMASPYKDVAPVNQKIEMPDKENAMFFARTNVDMQEDDPDYPAMLIANYIMGGGAGFKARLTARIRVKEGLSYNAGSDFAIENIDRGSAWFGYAIAAPQKMEKVEAAFKDEVANALKDGFTATEVAAAKSGALQGRAQRRAQDADIARTWVTNMYLGRTFAWSAALEASIEKMTASDVTAAFRKHINPEKITIIKVGDFAKTARIAAPSSPVDVKK